jgi:hypothetical protein
MQWIGLGLAALAGIFVGAFLWSRVTQIVLAPELSQLRHNMALDRQLALRTLRRELANYMVRFDPDRYLRLYRDARAADIAIGKADKASQQAQLATIAKKYPFYEDFDLVSAREHVLYPDVLRTYSLEDIEAHYLSIVKFHALQCVLDRDWKRNDATSDRDLEHLEKYVRQINDTKFLQRLKAALRDFRIHQHGSESRDLSGPIAYETDELAVYYVRHFAETRYGFHFKDTNEFGLRGLFFADSGKFYESFFRSDPTFESETVIDDLHLRDTM